MAPRGCVGYPTRTLVECVLHPSPAPSRRPQPAPQVTQPGAGDAASRVGELAPATAGPSTMHSWGQPRASPSQPLGTGRVWLHRVSWTPPRGWRNSKDEKTAPPSPRRSPSQPGRTQTCRRKWGNRGAHRLPGGAQRAPDLEGGTGASKEDKPWDLDLRLVGVSQWRQIDLPHLCRSNNFHHPNLHIIPALGPTDLE